MASFLRKDSWRKPRKFEHLANLPQQYCSKPIITNDDRIIIPTDKEYIYEYISMNNTWNKFCNYPNKLLLSGHTMCFNKVTQQLIIYDGKGKLIKINSNNPTNTQVININNIKTKDHCLCFIFPDNTINLIGGFKNNCHYISTNNGQSFQQIYKFNTIKNGIIGHGIIKLSKQNKLLMFGGWDYYNNSKHKNGCLYNNIWEFDTTNNNWKELNNIQMPYKMCGFGYVLSSNERYIIIFGGQKEGNKQYLNEIWYVDLDSNNMKWVKSSIKCPKKSGYHAIKTLNDNIHLFERVPNWKYGHFMINITEIITELKTDETKEVEMSIENDNKYIQQIETLTEKNDALKVRLYALQTQLHQKNENNKALNIRNKTLEDMNRNLNGRNESLVTENGLLNVRVNELENKNMEEKKEFDELKGKYDKMVRERLDTSNYMNWEWKDVLLWICNLENKRYVKYKNILLKTLERENIDGECLKTIEKSDLDRLGVVDFKDKTRLMKYIKDVVQGQQQEEGVNNAQTPYHDH